MKEALYWVGAGDNAVLCTLCPHKCRINDNATGICGVRANFKGTLFTPWYGMVPSLALDPVEKKPLYMFMPGRYVLSIGGYGCNLKCRFCQNYEISTVRLPVAEKESNKVSNRNPDDEEVPGGAARRPGGTQFTPEDILSHAKKTIHNGNIGVAYTYNEPLTGYEFLLDCAVLVRSSGLKNIIVTNGFINEEPLEALLPFIDAMNIDLKGFTEEFYRNVGGSLEAVKNTILRSCARTHVEITTLVIPGENEDDIEDLSKWLASIDPEIPLHLSRFFPRYRYSDRQATTRETILQLRDIAGKHLKNVFAGNM